MHGSEQLDFETLIIPSSTSTGVSERVSEQINERSGASELVIGASKRANGRVSVPVLTSRFKAVLNHSAVFALSREKKRERSDLESGSKQDRRRG